MKKQVASKQKHVEFRWYHVIYGSDEELIKLQDFDEELSEVPDALLIRYIRYFFFLLSLGTVILSAQYSGLQSFLIYFTHWTEVVGLISITLTIVVTQIDDIHVRTNLLASHHMLYTLSIFMNLVTMMVYWGLLHEECPQKYGPEQMNIFVKCYNCHIVPPLVCAVNSLMTNCKLSAKYIPVLISFGLFYGGVNCYTTKVTGKPVYGFMTWQGFDSVLIIFGMISGFSLIYLVLCWLDS